MKNKSLLWDIIKCEIRTITVSHACFKAKQKRLHEKTIIHRLEYLDKKISVGEEKDTSLKKELEEIYMDEES